MHAPERIGPYRILEPIGRGGMGVVYRGQHVDTGEVAAVKTVTIPDPIYLTSVRREIHTLSRLRHPNVVRIVDSGEERGLPWYAMDLLEGIPLRHVGPFATGIARTRKGSVYGSNGVTLPSDAAPALDDGNFEPVGDSAFALATLRRLCDGLAFLHGEGVVHRDLKPENILIRPSGVPVILDFGIVTRFPTKGGRERVDVVGHLEGTPAYMAPEQIRGEFVDARADLYSLGCLLYEAVAGRPPFTGSSGISVAAAHLDEAPRPPSSVAPDAPAALDDLILRLLAKVPADRVGYASDVAAALDALGVAGPSPVPHLEPSAYLYRPRFAGRGGLVEALSERLHALERGRGGLVLVAGESGIGKTRLAMEIARLAKVRGHQVVVGGCPPPAPADIGDAASALPLGGLSPLLDALADRCREGGYVATSTLLGSRAKLLARFNRAIAGLPGVDGLPEPPDLAPDAARRRLFEALARSVKELAGRKPLVVVIDDLHWADELTCGFLDFVASEQGAVPFALALATFRAEEAPPELWRIEESERCAHVQLNRLEEDAVGSVIADMLAVSSVPKSLLRFLNRTSEGNPFFIAEYLHTALEERILRRTAGGQWRVGAEGDRELQEADFERLGLPQSARGLFERRMGALTKSARAALSAAAVIGHDITYPLLSRVGELEGAALLDVVEEFLRHRVIEEEAPGTLRFAHDRIRELVYESIPAGRRVALHRIAAEALESEPGRKADATLVAIGRHWEGAGEWAKARGCYLSAGRLMRFQYASADSERMLRAAVALPGGPSRDGAAARAALGYEVLFYQGRSAEAASELEMSLAEAASLGARDIEALAARGLGVVRWHGGRLDEAEALYERALAAAREAGDRTVAGSALSSLAVLRHNQGRLSEALTLYQESLDLYREVERPWLVAEALGNIASLLHEQGRLGEARRLYERALVGARRSGNLVCEADTLSNLAGLVLTQGDPARAIGLYEAARRASIQADHRLGEADAQIGLAAVYRETGRFAEALPLLTCAADIYRACGDRRYEATAHFRTAEVLRLSGGDLAEADLYASEAETVLRELHAGVGLGLCLCERGHIALASGGSATAFLAEAKAYVAAAGAGCESELGAAVARLERAVTAHSIGRPITGHR